MIEHPDPLTGEPWLHVIDLELLDMPGAVCAFLVEGDGELALIETGPSTGRERLEAGIRRAGFRLGDVSRLIVTHIHLDHAGAVGGLMRDVPNVRLSVHPIGAPHMADPARLVASSTRIYGDRMDTLWGEVIGGDPERIDPVADGDVIRVAGRELKILYTPGHASHHVAIYDQASGVLFTGDVGGVRLEGWSWVDVAVPPPELDPDLWRTSIDVLRASKPRRLALTHFGLVDDVDAHLDQVIPNLEQLIELGRNTLTSGGQADDLTARILSFTADQVGVAVDDPAIQALQVANPAYMATMGLERYLRKRGELDASSR